LLKNQTYKTRAVSAWVFTGIRRCTGFSIENPARNIPYAAKMPNAIDPTDAQTNIAKSTIASVPI
jgi:hypothetical protein